MTGVLERLEATVAARIAAGDAASSHTARLAAKGLPKVAQKLGEEAVETVIALLAEGDAAVRGEAADLLFHLLVALNLRGVPLADVLEELERREGRSGIAEKEAR